MTASKKYFASLLFLALASYAIVAFAGAPLKGVDVKLGKNPGGSPVARSTTDGEGKFSFQNLPEGTYDLYCSYEECAKAINTKGTGATLRSSLDAASKDAAKFEIELLPTEGVSFVRGPRQMLSMDGSAQRGGDVKVTAAQNSQSLRVLLTSQSPGTSPIATITIAAKHKELTGHVTLIK